ncbi:TetR/AcrR family transcriptional regulator [Actinomadura verrucosospora]|uniref:TetR/AcrR family transcriptional regulator n=1 Tax=Actinomadura verrucosospora TaxID=46165 RepID=UPI001FEBE7C5|nr:TetR/AcrR family transcriptional regulator [Actinomadura verrucosospora]
MSRPLRADAERTVRTILEAAERVLSADPAATMEQIAEAAGVARTTVHRRFATRDALIDALTEWAVRRLAEAVDAAPDASAPPLVTLYQVTANVLEVKIGWGFAMTRAGRSTMPEVVRVQAEIAAKCDELFLRAQEAGIVRDDVDLVWARRVYYALLYEASTGHGTEKPGALATLVVDTLLRGIAAQPAQRL